MEWQRSRDLDKRFFHEVKEFEDDLESIQADQFHEECGDRD
jgi:hypothetical protein